MANCRKTLVFDPVTFKGGSKVATCDALAECRTQDNEFVVLTATPQFWRDSDFHHTHKVSIVTLYQLSYLSKKQHGLLYWFAQCILCLQLIVVALKAQKIHKIVGASGPGIDMAIYLYKMLSSVEVIQFIHGNVGLSRSIGYCLTKADTVLYLPSTRSSLKRALAAYLSHRTGVEDSDTVAESQLKSDRFQSFVNGIPRSRWPSPCQHTMPTFMWGASLLKWKGLDCMLDAFAISTQVRTFPLNVCFIRPKDISLPITDAPRNINQVQWYSDPDNLDEIRSQSNIFISTSHKEPFGLSILEALAAGMCVIIPQDGAFWDQQLTHNVDCIKYQPNNANALADALLYAASENGLLQSCGKHAMKLAKQYRADYRYHRFAQLINGEKAISRLTSVELAQLKQR